MKECRTTWEERWYFYCRSIREPFFRPFARFLSLIGIKPDWLSYSGVVFMLLFILFLTQGHTIVAFFCLVGCLCMDILDGTLARYQGVASDKGKFTDVLVDNVTFTLFVIGLLMATLVSGLVAVLYTYSMLLTKVLMIIEKNIKGESDWLIRPMVGAFPNMLVYGSYGLFALYVFTGTQYLQITSLIFAVLLIVHAILEYIIIKNNIFEPDHE